jgi:hypothetical protein
MKMPGRYTTYLLPLLFIVMTGADIQSRPAPVADPLPGRYVSTTVAGACSVERVRGGYLFVNNVGSAARFAYTAPGRLEMVAGDWDPTVVVTVSRDARGRTVLRFDSQNAAPGYWVSAG